MATDTLKKEIETYKKRGSCMVCHSSNLEVIFSQNEVEASHFPANSHFFGEECVEYPLTLVLCNNCNLVQVLEEPTKDQFNRQYKYRSSTSKTLRNHFENYSDWLKNNYNIKTLVEFGSNDGVLLKNFEGTDITCFGVDPTGLYSGNGKNVLPLESKFNLNLLKGALKNELNNVDVITGSNVFAHTPDLWEMLETSKLLLKENGKLIVEVQYILDMLLSYQFDFVYHEHQCYHSVTSIKNLFEMHGFTIEEVIPIDIHGGSIRVVATPNKRDIVSNLELKRSPSVEKYLKIEESHEIDQPNFYKICYQRWEKALSLLDSVIFKNKDRKICGYGAGGRTNVLLNNLKDAKYIDFIVDDSPSKQGLMTNKTNIPIVNSSYMYEESPEICIVFAYPYFDEITNKENYFKGEFINANPHSFISWL